MMEDICWRLTAWRGVALVPAAHTKKKRLSDRTNEHSLGWFHGGFVFGTMGDFLNNSLVSFCFVFFVWHEVLRFCSTLLTSESAGRDADGRAGDLGGHLRGQSRGENTGGGHCV